jgi:dTDP-glucose 4,6-dehydratase
MPKTVLVTGGAGFIGSTFLNLFVARYPDIQFVNVDKLTYAANPLNLAKIDTLPNYAFERADIADGPTIRAIFEKYQPDWVIHFAAESHVDRSIMSPGDFIQTNVVGTFQLLEAARQTWSSFEGKVFHHVSTDEVYGSLGATGKFLETTPYDPSSPYSSSKAASDHIVRAYGRTYGLPIKVTNCSNNYGPLQFPEKLVPLMILNAAQGLPLPVYGKGDNVRDWLYVDDHAEAIWRVASEGRIGETYNVGGDNERTNLEVVTAIASRVAAATGQAASEIKFVTDRPGHDHRYAIDFTKINQELGWRPQETFETGLAKTVDWYLANPEWVESIRTGAYRDWIDQNYAFRTDAA